MFQSSVFQSLEFSVSEFRDDLLGRGVGRDVLGQHLVDQFERFGTESPRLCARGQNVTRNDYPYPLKCG